MALPISSALHDEKQISQLLRRADEDRSSMVVYLPIMKDLYHLDAAQLSQIEDTR